MGTRARYLGIEYPTTTQRLLTGPLENVRLVTPQMAQQKSVREYFVAAVTRLAQVGLSAARSWPGCGLVMQLGDTKSGAT